ncbi:MAG TPA: hypothetical protein VGO50_17110 [Pyrinomonadaceae bacterium]|jgi:hypothetical protein|nr:hypothetical protein [Pyrinomonadaceae bacterium]
MAKKKHLSQAKNSERDRPGNVSSPPKSNLLKFSVIFLVAAVVITGGYFAYKNLPAQKAKTAIKPGIVTGCQKSPQFLAGLNFGNRAALSTSEKARPGLWMIEGDHRYQHPSWKNAGFLAPIERDQNGNIYVAPAPFINVFLNPAAEQNAVWRVDSKTQEMVKFLDLPRDAGVSEQNAYGTLDLAFDCETEALYVSSVFGSTRDKEQGKIYRIDTKTKQASPLLENIDGFGLSVFNTPKGKRLFYGLARRPEVWSVGLNDDGTLAGAPNGTKRKEASLENIGPRGDDKVRKIAFQANQAGGEMILFGIEFNFNLVAPTEKQETAYHFRYNAQNDSWTYVAEPVQVIQ